jgi:uncharacterized protein YneF (UPF0154 family)
MNPLPLIILFLLLGVLIGFYYYYTNIKNDLDNLLKNPPVLGKITEVIGQSSCNIPGAMCANASQKAINENNIYIDQQNSLLLLDYETKIYNDYTKLFDTDNINKMKTKIKALVGYMNQKGYVNIDGTPITTPF